MLKVTGLGGMYENSYGQLGTNGRSNTSEIESEHTTRRELPFRRKSDGSLWGMGWNDYGQLGDELQRSEHSVEIESGVVSVAAGSNHSLYLRSDGSLWEWDRTVLAVGRRYQNGSQHSGAIESGGVTSISAGYHASWYIKSNGSLWAMGRNESGMLGDGTTLIEIPPFKLKVEVFRSKETI